MKLIGPGEGTDGWVYVEGNGIYRVTRWEGDKEVHTDIDISTIQPPTLVPANEHRLGWIEIDTLVVHFDKDQQPGFQSIIEGILSWQNANGVA